MNSAGNGVNRPDNDPKKPEKTGKPRPESDGTRIVPPSGGEQRKQPQQAPKRPPTDTGGTQIVSPGGTQAVPPSGKPPQRPVQQTPASQKKPETPSGAAKPSTPPPPPAAEETDTELLRLRKALSSKYEITRKLGEGGMASVYHARELALEREVAIKVLPQSFGRDKQFVERFKREAQVAANLEHPHIVRIYQIGAEQGLVYFVMSYIPGGAISDRIKKEGPLKVDDIVQLGMDTASALGYAHDHGVIHPDLKPDNIMLDKSGRAIVMDYGIARAGQGTGLTQTGAVIGTPQFMSPEQARGLDLDARSDIYSMGLVLYQMATGTLPFKADDPASLMYMHVHETPEPPDVRNADVPSWLRDIILKCLAKNPDDRFASAKELRLALAEHKAPELTERTVIQARADKKKRRNGIFAAVSVFVVLIAAAGWYYLNSTKPAPIQPEITQTPQDQTASQEPATSAQPQVNADDIAFQQAEMINTRQAYLTYLGKYPDGANVNAASEKIAAFDEAERIAVEKQQAADAAQRAENERIASEKREAEQARLAEAARQDDTAYNQAVTANTVQSYSTYLQSFPLGNHVDEARSKIAALNAQESEALEARAAEDAVRDDNAFNIASNTGTKEAFSTYLISYPTGRHADEANSRIAAIDAREKFNADLKVKLSSLSITMSDIPGGTFRMGSNDGKDDEAPVREITISAYTMSTTEITQGQYNAVMNDNPSFHKLDDNLPVERVTYKEAITFCNRLSDQMKLETCYNLSNGSCDYTKNGFRLPTEAEWEYACRGGTGTDYNTGAGESALARAGWYQRNSEDRSHPVARMAANIWGLYDMHGNVWEWTNDFYSERSYEVDTQTTNPTGVPKGKDRVLRGGSWLDRPSDCRSATRREYNPEKRYSDIGFRIVRR